MEADILKEMPNGSNTHLACRVFITVHEQEKKTINCSLYLERNNDALTINTRVLGIADGWKTEALN
jgi:hypothetical protein